MGQVQVELLGADDMRKVIKQLPKATQRKVLIGIYKEAVKPMVRAARKNARPISNTLAKSIGAFASKQKSVARVFVGPRTGKRRKYDGWWAHFWEWGTRIRRPKKEPYMVFHTKDGWVRSKRVRRIAPRPFMTPAIDSKLNDCKGNILKGSQKVIQRYIKRGVFNVKWQ